MADENDRWRAQVKKTDDMTLETPALTAAQVKSLRKSTKMTRQQFADFLGISLELEVEWELHGTLLPNSDAPSDLEKHVDAAALKATRELLNRIKNKKSGPDEQTR